MKKLLFLLSLTGLTFGACNKNNITPDPDPTDSIGTKNPNPAQNNTNIIYQKLWTTKSSIYTVLSKSNELYAYGMDNGNIALMKITSDGNTIWSKSINGMSSFCLGDSYIYVTVNYNDRAKIVAYDYNGNYKAEISMKEDGYDKTLLNDIVGFPTDGRDGVIVGGYVQNGNTQHPYLRRLTFSGESFNFYEISSDVWSGPIRFDHPNQRIINLAYKDGKLFYTANKYTSLVDEPSTIQFVKLAPDVSTDNYADIYTVELKAESPQHRISHYTNSKIVFNGDVAYIAGYTQDDKEPAPSGGSYWNSGMVLSVKDNGTSGSVNWRKKITISNKSERVYDLTYYSGSVYVFGVHSALLYANKSTEFSNGMIGKINTDGSIIYSKTFGDEKKRNGFNTGIVINGDLCAFGYSGSNSNSSDYNAWIVKTSL
jgi:hypothetical protein